MLFITALGSVPVSMSALVTAPALITVMMVPVLIREKKNGGRRAFICPA